MVILFCVIAMTVAMRIPIEQSIIDKVEAERTQSRNKARECCTVLKYKLRQEGRGGEVHSSWLELGDLATARAHKTDTCA